jgi:hypothetical protein
MASINASLNKKQQYWATDNESSKAQSIYSTLNYPFDYIYENFREKSVG